MIRYDAKKNKTICSVFIIFSCPIGNKKKLKNGDIETRPPDKTLLDIDIYDSSQYHIIFQNCLTFTRSSSPTFHLELMR